MSRICPRICPNCQYARKATDSAPDWQCPSCQLAYNKAAGAPVTADYGRLAPVARAPAARGGAGKWLLLLLLVAGVFWFGKPAWLAGTPGQAKATAGRAQPEVVLYATSWCGYCAATRDFFAAHGIAYSELDIEASSSAYEGHRRLGGNGVPLVVIGDEIIHGYNESALRSSLKPWLK